MANPLPDRWDASRVDQLVRFDEALLQGRAAPGAPDADPELEQAQAFLQRLQSVWKRKPQRIASYEIRQSLGQGSIGPCYLVEERITRQPYVLKVLWPDLSAQPQAQRLFLQEAKALKLFQHVYVASVYEARAVGTFCYVVSRYHPGPSLAQWRRNRPQPIGWPVAAQCVAGLADILESAHRHGIVHGNLKPSNLFLPAEGETTIENLHERPICVSDLGLAKAIQQLRLPVQNGLPWPMPHYLAPEQLSNRRRPIEAASDLYALGVLLYELLTGRAPVKGTTRDEVFRHTSGIPAPSPRHYRPEIPKELEEILMTCLSKDPHSRPASARGLAEALRASTASLQLESQPAWWKQWLGWM